MSNDQHVKALLAGGDQWTQLNSTGVDLDFTNADLSSIDLNGFDFVCHANFNGCTFDRVELSSSTFQKGATFDRAKFNKPAELRPRLRKGAALYFSEAEFLDQVRIDDTQFQPGTLIFARSIFRGQLRIYSTNNEAGGALDFTNAEICSRFDAEGAHLGHVDFDGASFEASASFRGAVLYRGASFERAQFKRHANFENVKFEGSSSFLECTFHGAPIFHGAKLHQGVKFSPQGEFSRLFPDTTTYDASNAYRTLKLAMNAQHAHNEELGFFLLEMRSTANHQKPWIKRLHQAYDLVSNYGISVKRPLLAFIVMNVAIGLLYSSLARRGWGAWDPELLGLSLYGAIPFATALRPGTSVASLFPSDVQWAVPWLVAGQATLSAALLFLVGLGLRNMFKIK